LKNTANSFNKDEAKINEVKKMSSQDFVEKVLKIKTENNLEENLQLIGFALDMLI
jgi:hypothetical protein